MAVLLKGADVAAALNSKLKRQIEELKAAGIYPTIAMLRVGEREEDISYERGTVKACQRLGALIRQYVLPLEATQEALLAVIRTLNADPTVHGVLLYRPLPPQMDDNAVRNALDPAKDLDGISNTALASVLAGFSSGFPPCTAQACLELLDHYGIKLQGHRVVVIGRSLVVGKPLAMMLLDRDATITICHSLSNDIFAISREAEILVVAVGRAGAITKEYLSPGQTVIDVGIHVGEDGSLCGDVAFAEAEALVEAITPVPGGVGAVTTAVLIKHLIEAARRSQQPLDKLEA